MRSSTNLKRYLYTVRDSLGMSSILLNLNVALVLGLSEAIAATNTGMISSANQGDARVSIMIKYPKKFKLEKLKLNL